MHYQVIVSQDDISRIRLEAKGDDKFVLDLPGFNERITYENFNGTIRVIQESADGEVYRYEERTKYQPDVLPFMVALVCAVTGVRSVKLGESRHTVMIHTLNDTSRFIPVYNGSKIELHERNGLMFTKESDIYQAVSEEVIASEWLTVENRSLKLFNSRFLVRFEYKGGYVYYPATEVWADEVIREIRHRHIPTTNQLDWKGKAKQIEETLERYTSPMVSTPVSE